MDFFNSRFLVNLGCDYEQLLMCCASDLSFRFVALTASLSITELSLTAGNMPDASLSPQHLEQC